VVFWPWTVPAYALGLGGQMLAYMLIGTFFNLHVRGSLTSGALAGLTLATGAGVTWLWSRGPVAIEFWPGVISYAAALALFAACYAWRSRISAWGPLAWLADVSYPLYLVHAMPGYAIMRLLLEAGVSPWIAIVTAFGCALGTAAILNRWIEGPSQQLGRAWAKKLHAAASC
jgi:peptidoglycan/LPS O-acetylase OafA/YrhL